MAFSLNASDPLVVFGAVATLIFLGFAGNLIFSKLRFNDTLILILVGVIVGPVLTLVAQEPMVRLSAIIGPLALILILFDGGLALKFHDLLHGALGAATLGFAGFALTMAAVGGVAAWTLDIPFSTGLVLGAILGGTSAIVVLPTLEHLKTEKKTATMLGLESALTDILVVVVSFTMIAIVAAGAASVDAADGNGTGGSLDFNAQDITSKLMIVFAMSVFMGVAAGFLWLFLYPKVRDKPFGYMLTLGFMFALYVVVEWILKDVSSGGGPLSVLAFGVILGNYSSMDWFKYRVGEGFGEGMKKFQGEISFLVRTFFFVFLGIIVDLDVLADMRTLAIGLLVFIAMLVARYLAVSLTTRSFKLKGDAKVLFIMGPRGLAAAVLAGIPLQMGIPGTESFVAIAFLILVFTNLFATIGAFMIGEEPKAPKKNGAKPKAVSFQEKRSRSPDDLDRELFGAGRA